MVDGVEAHNSLEFPGLVGIQVGSLEYRATANVAVVVVVVHRVQEIREFVRLEVGVDDHRDLNGH